LLQGGALAYLSCASTPSVSVWAVYFMYPLLLISFLAFPVWISVADATLVWAASGPVGAGLVFADLA
jgi:hypothetical protein